MTAASSRSVLVSRRESGQKHVLLVSVLYPPSRGGVEAAAGEFARILPMLGFRVTVATTTPQSEPADVLDVHVFPREGFSASVAALARTIRVDLVLVNGLFLLGDMGLPFDAVAAAGIPVVYRAHGFNTTFQFHWRHPPFFGIPSFFRSFWTAFKNDMKFAKLSQSVFLDSATGFFRNFDVLLAKRFHPKNVSFIPNAFTSLFCSLPNGFRRRFGLDPIRPLFLCVANYSELKGQEFAVDIIRRNPALHATFVFVGSKANEVFEKAKRRAGDDSRIKLLVDIPRAIVKEAVNACDVAFLFSTHEQQPLFLSEAMSCGKPWFCTNVGSVSKMKGGIVLRRRNERCFVDAAKKLLSEDIRQDLGAAGRAFWKANYSPDVVYDRWKRLLNDVIAGQATCRY